MLSENLRNLKGALSSALDEDRLTEEMLRLAVERIGDLADQAEIMENSAIPLAAQLNDWNLHPNVIRLADRLHRRGVTVGMPPSTDKAS